PSSRSASIRSSTATSRSSLSRRISACAKSSNANSASGGPRHSARAFVSRRARSSAPAVRAAPSADSNRCASICSPAISRTEAGPRRPPLEHLRTELPTELGDGIVQRRQRSPRRLLAPQVVHQAIRAHDVSGPEQQGGEQSPLPSPSDDDRLALRADFERAEN